MSDDDEVPFAVNPDGTLFADLDPHLLAHLSAAECSRLIALNGRVERRYDLCAWSVYHLRHRLTSYNPDVSPRHGLSDFHRAFMERADSLVHKRGRMECFLAPRSSGKTTLANLAFPLREACEVREPFIIIGSDTQRKARSFLRNIKFELERNATLKADYPDACGVGPVWTMDEIHLRNGVVIKAISRGENIRGLLDRSRPTMVLL